MRKLQVMEQEYLNTLSQAFIDKSPGAESALCIQCGTCSGSCPLAAQMDNSPRKILALIRDGCLEEALRSKSIWLCVSCNACLTRCPRGIPVPDIMYRLRVLALQHQMPVKEHKMPDLYQAFVRQVEKRGRVNEARLAVRYGFSHPRDLPGHLGLAMKLLKKGRI